MEVESRPKPKKLSERSKLKPKKHKRNSGFAMDFTYYSKVLKAEQNKKKSHSGKPGAKLRGSNQNNLLKNIRKGTTNRDGKGQDFLKRHRRNNHSHNHYTISPMTFGISKKQSGNGKEGSRNALTARSNQTGEIKKMIEANKKSTVISSNKHQYFIDSHMKKNRSPDILRMKKKSENESKFKKKLALNKRKRRKTRTCTEGQLQRIKFQAGEISRNKLKQSIVSKKSNLSNFQQNKPSSKIKGSKLSQREVISSSKVFRKKNTKVSHKRPKKNNKQPKKHFDLSIPIPKMNESDGLEQSIGEIEASGIQGPYISYRNSRRQSRQVSPQRGLNEQSKYRKEMDKLERNSRGSPLRKLEQTGFTIGSNYTSISSKNYKNDSTSMSNKQKISKNQIKGHSHQRNFSNQYSYPLKNSSQFSQRIPKNLFQKQSMGDSTHQSYASIQSSNTISGPGQVSRFEKKELRHHKKGGFQGHRKNLSTNFGYSPFLKNSK